jgi:hypothetical protein
MYKSKTGGLEAVFVTVRSRLLTFFERGLLEAKACS